MVNEKQKKYLVIIDGNSISHRAYHALPPLTTKKGEPVGAVYGFFLVFFKTLKEFKPDFVVATFDLPAPTFRHKEFVHYKAQRPKMPDELSWQIFKIKEILSNFNVPIFEKEGFEADDLIGTISKLAPKKQIIPPLEVIVLSGDSDILQLVDPNTKVYNLKKGVKNTILYDTEKVKEKYQGLTPQQLPDFYGLKGDSSDNIPGVKGVGEKTGIQLIKEFENLENLYEELEINTDKAKKLKIKLKQILLNSKNEAFFSKNLAKIKIDVPIDFNLEKCRFGNYKKEKIIEIFKSLEFYSLIEKIS
jgi:DNA polymerase-1